MEESIESLEMAKDRWYFQKDNDPKHTAKKAEQWFSDNNIIPMKWPAQSPDLNPIEHLWQHLKAKFQQYDTPPKGVHELWNRVAKEWTEIPPETCQKLIENMPSVGLYRNVRINDLNLSVGITNPRRLNLIFIPSVTVKH